MRPVPYRPRSVIGARLAPLLPVLFSFACEPPAERSFTVRDSAGVRIVESREPRWTEETRWRVGREPLLAIGAVEGPAETAFDRILSVHPLGDGSLAVVDAGANEVRFFDPEGRFLRSFGRQGSGPGEFGRIQLAGLEADSVWLYDSGQSRLTLVHGASGTFRTASVDVQNVALGAAGMLEGGSIVFVADHAFTDAIEASLPAGVHRFQASFLHVGTNGALLDTLLVVPGREHLLQYAGEAVQITRLLFAKSVSHAVRDGHLLQGPQDAYEIRIHDLDGRLTEVLRRTDVDLILTDEAFEAAVEQRVARAPEEARPGARAFHRDQPRPATRPAYSRFLVDAVGNLWVQAYDIDGEARTWSVFGVDGAWLGDVTLPERFRPTHVTEDRIYGVWRDELDVEYASVYGLERR